MGKSLQVRGTIQAIDLRTLNAEINEVLKDDLGEIDLRSIKEFVLSPPVIDQEVNFLDGGITLTKFLFIRSDIPISVKVNSVTSTPFNTTLWISFAEINKLYLSASATAKVRIIALK